MSHRKYLLCTIGLILLTTLACTTFSTTSQKVESGLQTAQSMATQAQALITQAQGVATQVAPLMQTAQAIATHSPDLVQTAQAVATQSAPYISTIQAAVTDNPEVVQTLQAAITQNLGSGTAPVDVPIPEASLVTNLITAEHLVTYSTSLSFEQVQDFYQTGMLSYGWEPQPDSTYQLSNTLILVYHKADRGATISLSANTETSLINVIIAIYPR